MHNEHGNTGNRKRNGNAMQGSPNRIDCQPDGDGQGIRGNQAVRDRYAVALDAALLILEEVDTLPKSNAPVRLAKVIGIVLDAIYESERQPNEGRS